MTAPTQLETQSDIDVEIDALPRPAAQHGSQPRPARDYPPYRSSILRHPRQNPIRVADPEAAELRGPVFGVTDVTAPARPPPARPAPPPAAGGGAARRADHRHRPGAGPPRPPDPPPAGGDLAG